MRVGLPSTRVRPRPAAAPPPAAPPPPARPQPGPPRPGFSAQPRRSARTRRQSGAARGTAGCMEARGERGPAREATGGDLLLALLARREDLRRGVSGPRAPSSGDHGPSLEGRRAGGRVGAGRVPGATWLGPQPLKGWEVSGVGRHPGAPTSGRLRNPSYWSGLRHRLRGAPARPQL